MEKNLPFLLLLSQFKFPFFSRYFISEKIIEITKQASHFSFEMDTLINDETSIIKKEAVPCLKEEEKTASENEEKQYPTNQNSDIPELANQNKNTDKPANQDEEIVDLTNQSKEEPTTNQNDVITDEYHYTQSGEYTSEMFKVVVQNIPGKVSYGVSN